MDEHPAVRVDLEEQSGTDIGVFADRTSTQGVLTVPYRPDELVLIAPWRSDGTD